VAAKQSRPARCLGIHGPGKVVLLDGSHWHISHSTKGMQIAYAEDLKAKAKREFDADAADMRKRAVPLWNDAKHLQEELEGGTELPDARKAELLERYEAAVNEARALEYESRDSLDRFKEAKAAGDYEFYGRVGMRALATTAGQMFMCWLMLKPKHPELTLEDVEQLHRGLWEIDGVTLTREDVLTHRNVKSFAGNKISRIELWQICLLMADGLFEKKEPTPKDGQPAPASSPSDGAASESSSSMESTSATTAGPPDAKRRSKS